MLKLSFQMKENDKALYRLISIANAVSQTYDVSITINALLEKTAILLYKVMRSYSKDTDFVIGENIPAYCSSAGKLLLSFYSEAQLSEYFSGITFLPYQGESHSEKSLREEILTVRKQGFAICDEEYISGMFSFSLPFDDGHGHVYAFTVITTQRDKKRVFKPEVIREIRDMLDSCK